MTEIYQSENQEQVYYKPINPAQIPQGWNNIKAETVNYRLTMVDNYQARLQLRNSDPEKQYQVEEEVFERPIESFESRITQLGFEWKEKPFSFSMKNIYTENEIFSTEKRKLFLSDKFSEIGFRLPNKKIFGLGQRNSQFQLKNGTQTLWAKGQKGPMQTDNGSGGLGGSHVHPFILGKTNDTDFYGMFFVSTAMQAFEVVYFDNFDSIVLNYITLGGDIEIYFFIRGSANDIIKKYHNTIGFSQMPPYYALGVFQGSPYYNDDKVFKDVIQGYESMDTALEGYIIERYHNPGEIFTLDDSKYPNLKKTIKDIRSKNQHVILGLSASIKYDEDFEYFNLADELDVLIESNVTNDVLVGYVEQTNVTYPDFFNEKVEQFYEEGFKEIQQQLGGYVDGIEFKHLQFFNQINGEIKEDPKPKTTKRTLEAQKNEESVGQTETYRINKDQQQYSYQDVPVVPGYTNSGNLDNQTISMDALRHGYDKDDKRVEYYVHNANGHLGLKRIQNVLKNMKTTQRTVVYSDATWAGSGAHGAATITNLYRSWDNMKNTIAMVMSLNMYGVSNTIVDVCGTRGPMNEELCARWMQLAAFLPMARNYYFGSYYQDGHYHSQTPGSELPNFEDFGYQVMASSAVIQRLEFTRYIYSQMYKVYREGGSLVRPMFFDYPEDTKVYDDIEHTFMLGEAIKVSPVLGPNVDKYQVYFPEGDWADLNNITPENKISSKGETFELMAQQTTTNVHLKSGKIIPHQLNANSFKTTKDYETKAKMNFIIHRDESEYAEGHILVDDGLSISSYEDQEFTYWKLRYAERSINFWPEYGNYEYEAPKDMTIDQLGEIKILYAEDLKETDFACYLDSSFQPTDLTIDYNGNEKSLTLKPKSAEDVIRFRDLTLIRFGNSLKEANLCDNKVYQYNVVEHSIEDDDYIKLVLKNSNEHIAELIFEATLLDDEGNLYIKITTEHDGHQGKKLFDPFKYVGDLSKFEQKNTTRHIQEFLNITDSPFSYQILDSDTEDVLYQSNPFKLYFSDYLVFDSGKFSMNPDTDFPLMGMGEKAGDLFYKKKGIHTRYSFDQANPIDTGVPPGKNMYGFQPFYMFQSNNTRFVGVFNLNSYAMDFVLDFDEDHNAELTNIMIGGFLQKFYFQGDKPDEVITSYQKLVGNPVATPLWSFGWQQCRFGWVNDQIWYDVYKNYTKYDLPLDTMWADIDYLDDYKIFTVSEEYKNLKDYIKEIKNNDKTFVPIVDAAVAVRKNQNYKALEDGMKQDVFIKQSNGKDPLTGGVWCGNAYFPDFFNDKAVTYWHNMLDYMYDDLGLQFDGIWLDMNEATNFCDGYCIESERPKDSLRNKPPYVPGFRDLEDKSLGVDGLHEGNIHEYDVHNMFSLKQVEATSTYLTKNNKIPYVLSRSNFPGMGKYGHHWLGDNWSTVEYMKYSVHDLYEYQIFGMPFIGSDICGFNSDLTDLKDLAKLCTRWHQLGSLYPFSRNHNQNATLPHEPYRFDFNYNKDTTYLDIIRDALRTKYDYIRYYYSSFKNIEAYGGSFFKPLFFEFPKDKNAYKEIENNILLGNGLKASIQTQTLDEKDADFYFPEGKWCQVYPMISKNDCFNSKRESKTMESTLEDYYIHMRNGHIIPMQAASGNQVNSTKDIQKMKTDLLIMVNDDLSHLNTGKQAMQAYAAGMVIFDDGVKLDSPVGRFDIFYLKKDNDQGAQIMILQDKEKDGKRTDREEEVIGEIKILFASDANMNKQNYKAEATMKNKKVVELVLPVYDDEEDSLIVTCLTKEDNQPLSFYDITEVEISIQENQ